MGRGGSVVRGGGAPRNLGSHQVTARGQFRLRSREIEGVGMRKRRNAPGAGGLRRFAGGSLRVKLGRSPQGDRGVSCPLLDEARP